MDADLAFALELADIADAITTRHFRSAGLAVEAKADLTPVTLADREAEEALRAAIEHARPRDAILGEEQGAGGEGPARWILDPIDGTRNYVRGIPVYATLIALERDGAVTTGVVSAPMLETRWWAARGEGAHANGARLAVSRVASIEDAAFSHGGTGGDERLGVAFARLAARAWAERGFGDFWQHMLVAEGRLDFAIDPIVAVWDLAAVQVIVEEAGGRFTDLAGRPQHDGGSGLSSNGLLHDAVLAALNPGAQP